MKYFITLTLALIGAICFAQNIKQTIQLYPGDSAIINPTEKVRVNCSNANNSRNTYHMVYMFMDGGCKPRPTTWVQISENLAKNTEICNKETAVIDKYLSCQSYMVDGVCYDMQNGSFFSACMSGAAKVSY